MNSQIVRQRARDNAHGGTLVLPPFSRGRGDDVAGNVLYLGSTRVVRREKRSPREPQVPENRLAAARRNKEKSPGANSLRRRASNISKSREDLKEGVGKLSEVCAPRTG